MRRSQYVWALLWLPLGLARCQCDETLNELPFPEIDVRDPLTDRALKDPVTNEGEERLIIDFGTGEVGTRAERNVEIGNLGNELLQVTNISFAPTDPNDPVCPVPSSAITFKDSLQQRPFDTEKGASQTLTLAFETVGGNHCRILVLRSNDPDEGTVKVYFTASGQGPKLCAPGNDTGVIDFGHLRPGTTREMVQRIESCGTAPVQVTDLAIQDGLTPAFTIVAPTVLPGTEFPPCNGSNQAECGLDVTLRFAPPSGGVFQGTLNVTTASAAGNTLYPFQLVGKGAECNLQVVPTTVTFGAVASGQTATQTVLLRNIGVCHCQVDQLTAIAPSDNGFSFISPPATPLVLTGSEGCEGDPTPGAGATNQAVLQVQYDPGTRTNASTDNASFHVMSASNTPSPDTTVNLEATGGGTPRCELAINPSLPAVAPTNNPFNFLPEGQDTYQRYGLIRFGNTVKDNTKRLPITLTNRGNTNCTVSGISWDAASTPQHHFGMADANDQPLLVGGNPGLTIAPGDTLTLKATYLPTDASEKWNGAKGLNLALRLIACGSFTNACDGNGVVITTNAENIDTTAIGGGPGVISFGFNAASVAPAIDVIPGEVDFGLVTLGCGSEEREIKVYNTGNADLVIVGTAITPAATPEEFRITASPVPPNVTVAPGQSIRVKVRFYPRHVGAHDANLVITSDAGGGNFSEFTVPLHGEGTTESNVTDVFRQLTEPQVDVLWVVDDSGSMSEEQTALGQNFPAFFAQTSINNVDYHIAVTTTLVSGETCIPDITNPTAPCNTTADPEAGLYTACSGNDKFITRTTSNAQSQFACNVSVADHSNVRPSRAASDSQEAGLQAAKLFLSEPHISDPAANGGFLRDDAKLYVIMISDEEDQSNGPVDLYVDFFQNLKGFRNRNLVSVSAIAGGVPTACAEAEPGTRYKDAVDAIANGLFLNICTNDWGTYLQQLAFDSFGLKSQFFLSRNADPTQLQVCISDQDIEANPAAPCTTVNQRPEGSADGYFYEASTNSVVFNPGSVPPRGQYIRVTYEAYCYPLAP